MSSATDPAVRPRHRRSGDRVRRRWDDGCVGRGCGRPGHPGGGEVRALRRLDGAVRRRDLGARCSVAAPRRPRARPRRRVPVSAADHRWSGQRCAATDVRRRRTRDDGVPRKAQSLAGVRVEARLRRLLPRTARRLGAGQHHQRARHRSARPRRRGAAAARAAGVGSQGNLVRAQGPAVVLPGSTVVAGQGRAGEADLADVPGPRVRRPDGRDRSVAGGTVAAGDEAAEHPAVARCPDDRVDHRCRRRGGRCGHREERERRPGPGPPWRRAGQRWVRPRHAVAQGASPRTRQGRRTHRRRERLEFRQSGRHG